jgi:hypothetical protein
VEEKSQTKDPAAKAKDEKEEAARLLAIKTREEAEAEETMRRVAALANDANRQSLDDGEGSSSGGGGGDEGNKKAAFLLSRLQNRKASDGSPRSSSSSFFGSFAGPSSSSSLKGRDKGKSFDSTVSDSNSVVSTAPPSSTASSSPSLAMTPVGDHALFNCSEGDVVTFVHKGAAQTGTVAKRSGQKLRVKSTSNKPAPTSAIGFGSSQYVWIEVKDVTHVMADGSGGSGSSRVSGESPAELEKASCSASAAGKDTTDSFLMDADSDDDEEDGGRSGAKTAEGALVGPEGSGVVGNCGVGGHLLKEYSAPNASTACTACARTLALKEPLWGCKPCKVALCTMCKNDRKGKPLQVVAVDGQKADCPMKHGLKVGASIKVLNLS